LSAAVERAGDPARHPWRDMERESLDLDAREKVADVLQLLARELPAAQRALEACSSFGVPRDLVLADGAALAELAACIERSPGVERALAADDAWSSARPAEAAARIARGRALVQAEARASTELNNAAPLAERVAAVALVELHAQSLLRWL